MSIPKRRTIDRQCTGVHMYPHRHGQDERSIRAAVESLYPTQPYATHGSVCADLLLHAMQKSPLEGITYGSYGHHGRRTIIDEVRRTHRYMVGTILVYSANVKDVYGRGTRRPKSLQEQNASFKRNLYAAWPTALAALKSGQTNQGGASEGGSSGSSGQSQGSSGLQPQPITEPAPEPDPEPVLSTVVEPTCPLRAHYKWSVEVARLFEQRDKSWSYRPTVDGIALIAAGCDPRAVRDSCLMDYPDDLRAELGVTEPFDFASIDILDYLVKAASARVDQRGVKRPVCLAMVGPAGTGKTTLSEALAERLGTAYYDLSMSAGTPLSAFYGREGLGGDVRTSQFERWARDGGLHLFDEMDCSEPNLLKIVNKALANRSYTNPLTGESIKLSEDAVAVACMNTLGVGVQTEYSAAEQLDFSTIDRFRAGRIRVVRDYNREASIVDEQIASIEANQ